MSTKAEVLNKRYEHSRVVYIDDLMRLAKREDKKKFAATDKLHKISASERKITVNIGRIITNIYLMIKSIDSFVLSLILKYYSKRRIIHNDVIGKAVNTSKEVQKYLGEL